MHAGLVTTTIRVPRCLDALCADGVRHPGPMTRLTCIVVGDRKSDPATGPYLSDLARRHGIDVQWWDLGRQRAWLSRFPALDAALPEDCIQRRNVGYLAAYEAGCQVIISVDDDNFLGSDPFFPGHLVVGAEATASEVSVEGGWWDPCRLMRAERGRRVYHRGYPMSLRGHDGAEKRRQVTRIVRVNVGLWTGVPDANALSHIEDPTTFTGFLPEAPVPTLLHPETLAPFNSQNTAWDSKLLPAFFLVVMGDEVDGLRVGRYDDIWQSYFTQMVQRATQDGAVLYGRPLLEQRRNPHDFLDDMAQELPAARMTEALLPFFRIQLSGGTPGACYADLCERLEAFVAPPRFRRSEVLFWRRALVRMRAWLSACESIMGTRF